MTARGARRGRALAAASPVLANLLGALFVLFVLGSLVFFAIRVLPGDPAALVLGDEASEHERAILRAHLGLDRPLLAQYWDFARGIASLDLGDSLRRPGTPAFGLVLGALYPTSLLAILGSGMGACAGVMAAVFAVGPWLGRRAVWVHRGVIAVSAVPLLAFAPFFTWLFAVRFHVVPLPGDPEAGLPGLLFASGLLALPLGAQVARVARAALLDLGRSQFLDVAAAKGASRRRVWLLHALPVASAPIATVVATQLGALLGGAVVLERLFERPGLGTVMLDAYASRDLPVLEAAVMASGLLFVLAQGAATLLSAIIDPRGQEP
jgi:peptide/nickel transport system permease protein